MKMPHCSGARSGQHGEIPGEIGRRHIGRLAIEGEPGLLQRTDGQSDAALAAFVRNAEAIAQNDCKGEQE